jgi:hypothetical protein
MPPAAWVLTPKGRRKIDAVLGAVRQSLERGLAFELLEMRSVAAATAPNSEEEARLLSTGVAQGGVFSGQQLGTPDRGRFLRQAGQVSLREAIATDPIVLRTEEGGVRAGTGNPAQINARTGFFWRTRRRGTQGPTEPFNLAYVQAVENGGVVWTVVPRDPQRLLEPEDSVLVRQMAKTMPPFQMFRRTLAARRGPARTRLAATVRKAVRLAARSA